MRNVITETWVVAVNATKRIQTNHENGAISWRTEPDGVDQGTIELTIDVEKLARRLGGRAIKSKTGKSTALSGLVKAKVIKGSITRHYPRKEAAV